MTWVRITREITARSVAPIVERTFRRGELVRMERVDGSWWTNFDIDAALIVPGTAARAVRPQPIGTCWWCGEPIWANKTFGYAHGPYVDNRTSCCNGQHCADPGPGHGP